uniref:Methyltransferase n=1 Tax=Micromonas pusilla TaxID=38833 RepID=A0A7S0NQE4_MICPS|mmetsp:Transcript_9733/g.39850  ORF Transcript_9733/g.39850 Transcript_9733/m.39850 type:complete len:325 (+) Transcript_9733:96-1070(+)
MSDKTREDVEILGVNHTLAIDPDSLNEAGVVWAPAVRALAAAVAPIVVAEAEARRSSSAVASSSSAVDSSTDRAPTTRILELGAGTGALGIALACAVPDVRVTLTDLDRVVPLLRTNADETRGAGKLARGSELRVAELAWSRDTVLGLDDGGGVDRRDGRARWDVVLGCEILYWGGWDVFADDTRGPLLEACVAACEAGGGAEWGAEWGAASSPPTLVALAFTVRDKARESGYVAGDFGEKFWLRRLDADASRRETDEAETRRMDAEARARIEAAEEGDLLVLGAVAKKSAAGARMASAGVGASVGSSGGEGGRGTAESDRQRA